MKAEQGKQDRIQRRWRVGQGAGTRDSQAREGEGEREKDGAGQDRMGREDKSTGWEFIEERVTIIEEDDSKSKDKSCMDQHRKT